MRIIRDHINALIALLFFATYPTTLFAREPATTHSYQPGVTIGIPIAAPLPPGIYLFNESNFYSSRLTAANSTNTKGQPTVESFAEAPKFIWQTPYTFLGAKYLAWMVQPFVVAHVAVYTPYQSGLAVSYTSTVISPINLSWQLAPSFFVSGMFTINVNDAPYNKYDFIIIPNHFWTFTPEMGVTYLTDHTNLTIHLLYTIDTNNVATGYQSGSQLFADITAVKKWDAYEAGLVAYFDKQVTGDYNSGRYYPLSIIQTRPFQFAPGLFASYQKDNIIFQIYGTKDVIARYGALKGYRIYSRIKMKLS